VQRGAHIDRVVLDHELKSEYQRGRSLARDVITGGATRAAYCPCGRRKPTVRVKSRQSCAGYAAVTSTARSKSCHGRSSGSGRRTADSMSYSSQSGGALPPGHVVPVPEPSVEHRVRDDGGNGRVVSAPSRSLARRGRSASSARGTAAFYGVVFGVCSDRPGWLSSIHA
jgi:hypothetical protein